MSLKFVVRTFQLRWWRRRRRHGSRCHLALLQQQRAQGFGRPSAGGLMAVSSTEIAIDHAGGIQYRSCVDRCTREVRLYWQWQAVRHPHLIFPRTGWRRREPNGSGRPSNALQGGGYERLGRVRSFAAPFASRGPLPDSCCQTPINR